MRVQLRNSPAAVGRVALAALLATGTSAAVEQVSIGQVSSTDCSSIDPSFRGAISPLNISETPRSVNIYMDSWDKRDARRFKELAVKQAVNSLNSDELNEFLMLQSARRMHESPLTGDEILADFKRSQMLDDLIAFFEKHTVILPSKPQDPSRARA